MDKIYKQDMTFGSPAWTMIIDNIVAPDFLKCRYIAIIGSQTERGKEYPQDVDLDNHLASSNS